MNIAGIRGVVEFYGILVYTFMFRHIVVYVMSSLRVLFVFIYCVSIFIYVIEDTKVSSIQERVENNSLVLTYINKNLLTPRSRRLRRQCLFRIQPLTAGWCRIRLALTYVTTFHITYLFSISLD